MGNTAKAVVANAAVVATTGGAKGVVKKTVVKTRAKVPARPTKGNPVDYGTGRIYKGCGVFRVIRVKGDYNTEKKVRFTLYGGERTAWLAALDAVDDYH